MKSYNFEYDGLCLSDFGFIICNFGSGNGLESISNGSQITFNTISMNRGSKFELTSTQYNDCLQTTFYIAKNVCNNSVLEISQNEMRNIMSWLNRKGFHKLKFLDEEYSNIYFEASFNVNRYEMNDKIYGFELNVITNRPYALIEEKTFTIKNTSSNGTSKITDLSDEEGFIYPNMTIQLLSDGNLIINNSIENRDTIINNCSKGEVITLEYPIITSSLSGHKIMNDFNWTFFRIANTYSNKENNITISLPCNITLSYSPIAKIGL